MKKIISAVLAVLMITALFASCKKQENKRAAYNYDMSEYVTLGEYKGITINRASEIFVNYKNSFFDNDISEKSIYIQRKEGTVAKGDLTNFTYDGKVKATGEAIDANTTTLTVGSGQFIPGFEDNLVGKKIGSSFSFDITFPENYGDGLSGVVATFAITINYVNDKPAKDEDFAKKMGFASLAEYEADLERRVVNELVTKEIIESDKFVIKSYPEAEKKVYDDLYNSYINYATQQVESYKQQYGTDIDVDTILYYSYGVTSAGLKEYYENTMRREVITYAIFDKEKLSYTTEEYNKYVEELAAGQSMTVEELKSNMNESTIEANMVFRVVLDFLNKNAKIIDTPETSSTVSAAE
ncbi:MAG: FKBP-type peptidyl-prolyl cis-trans isomerase [Clostridiales bacterium]|nr:FKBP-type peptidyl-prolyl cis-trans isomerase [Candidatus Equinaster intestinalis]